ncbi:hypothetical protein BCV70DRAFT_201807 [Testicularia cyperi]|uniref:S-adenosyl-L-methionine-dependent methyltransferase n=1 Tax=Testicularia cyperi TaxID=1882483 RepID=A0A317XJP2_9BASI|nr:hypothetical protein BCV70DRAFT_201807 [Testicularia cyperi]
MSVDNDNNIAARVDPTRCLPRVKTQPSAADVFCALCHLALLYSPKSLGRTQAELYSRLSRSTHAHATTDRDDRAYIDAFDAARVDDNERRFAMDWITRIIGSGLDWIDVDVDADGDADAGLHASTEAEAEGELLAPDALLDLAGRVLGGHAGLEEAGAISRDFAFPLLDPVIVEGVNAEPPHLDVGAIQVTLRDDPLPPSTTSDEAAHDSYHGAAAAVGVQTWGSAIIMSDTLVRHPALFHPALSSPSAPPLDASPTSQSRLEIAELGAGTGLVGMVTAKLLDCLHVPAHLMLTDYHDQVLTNLDHNVRHNFGTLLPTDSCVSVRVERLDWQHLHQELLLGAPSQRKRYDLLLLADVVYAPEHAAWIHSSISTLLKKPQDEHEASKHHARAHIFIAVRTSGKFEGLPATVEDAFRTAGGPSRWALPSLSSSNCATPLETTPGTPDPISSLTHPALVDNPHASKPHHTLLHSRIDAIQTASPPQLSILAKRRLPKRAGVGRLDEQEYLWFEVGWT